MSRYETGIHEPPLAIAEKLAEALTVPLPYFYCADDRLAALILRYATLDEADRERVAALAAELEAGAARTGAE
jgi:transcriptional regulator with XRE-family HTH domain